MIGRDLVEFITNLRSKLNEVSQFTEVWNLKKERMSLKFYSCPGLDSLPEDASDVLGYQVRALGWRRRLLRLFPQIAGARDME